MGDVFKLRCNRARNQIYVDVASPSGTVLFSAWRFLTFFPDPALAWLWLLNIAKGPCGRSLSHVQRGSRQHRAFRPRRSRRSRSGSGPKCAWSTWECSTAGTTQRQKRWLDLFASTLVGFAIPALFSWSRVLAVVRAPSDAQVLLRRCMGEPEVFQSVAKSLQM